MNSNQFIITPVAGLINRVYSPFTVSGRHNPAAENNLVAGSPVKVVNGQNGSIYVALAEAADTVYGVAGIFNPIHNTWKPGATLEIAQEGTHIYFPVSAAVNAGQPVVITVSGGNATVAPAAAGANYAGIAATGTTTVGNFIEIVVKPGTLPEPEAP